MKKASAFTAVIILLCITYIFSECNSKGSHDAATNDFVVVKDNYNGFESQVKWGEHLVGICGCNDCHTPKKMGANGPEPDMANALSGHPSQMPLPDIDRKLLESKGLSLTNDLTVWVGPWGVSFASNITPDSTGIGSWKEEQFLTCIKQGKWMGLEQARIMLPPMPWQGLGQSLSDNELKAMFSYLKSVKPVHNIVPQPLPPATALK